VTALLLDTGVFAMALTDDPRLPPTVRDRIEAANRVVLSVVSFYEIGQKVRLGKWPAMAPFAAGLLERAFEDGFDPIPLSPAVALSAALMEWQHRDPFDRLIAATALVEALPIVSPDVVFDAIGTLRVWA